ncbi:uncharacterized protein LOC111641805 [Centruroides sculpturatus]|uniref:uncharacterized protein LOC111641805 n=1 Tax=Centruroides sculpturatus TaxID=218467 RepID=UPI000C6C9A29|nr:uncharacterized protein LOC111641805 [Centruroides sculpturatus]
MKLILILFYLFLVSVSSEVSKLKTNAEDKYIKEYIEKALEDFRSEMRSEMPNFKLPILEPLKLPGVSEKASHGTLTINEMYLYGLSNFEKYVNVNMKNGTFYVKLTIPELRIDSDNYNLRANVFLITINSKGRFHVIVHKPECYLKGEINVNNLGYYEVKNLEADANFDHARVDWSRMGGKHLMIKGIERYIKNNAHNVFHQKKSSVLNAALNDIQNIINNKLKTLEILHDDK